MLLYITRSLLLSLLFLFESNDAVEPFHSPFTARPLRIRLVNYERQYLPARHVATPAEEIAERLVAPHAHNMPHYRSSSFSVMQQNDEPIQSFPRNAYAGSGSYLQEVRRRMRAGKIHTASTALTIPNVLADESVDSDPRHLFPTNDARRLFDNEDTNENRTRFTASSSQKPATNVTTPSPLTQSTTQSVSQTVTASTEASTTPVKVRPVLPREDIIPLDEDTDKPKNVSLQPFSELEIKSDFALQKSLQRTTMRVETYTERPAQPARPKSSFASSRGLATTTVHPVVFTLPTLFPIDQTIGQLPVQPQLVNGSLGTGFPPPFSLQQGPQQAPLDRQQLPPTSIRASTDTATAALEQLGCGFDLLTQTCKDVFALSWCAQCTDLGNVFLHDCKCAAPTQLGRTANALFTSPTTPLPSGQANNNNGFLPTQQPTWTRTRN